MPSYYQPSHSHTITKTQFESNLAYGFIVILHYMINFSRNFPPNQLYCNRYSRYDSDAAYYVLNTTPTCYNDHTQQRLGRAFPCQRRLYGVSSTTFAADDLTVGATSLPKNCLEDEREREGGGIMFTSSPQPGTRLMLCERLSRAWLHSPNTKAPS